MEDAPLVARFKAGDEAAFIPLYRKYADPLYRYILRRVSNPAEAEDLTSDTFLAALNQLRTTELTAHFKPWLFAIAVNKIKAYWTKVYRMPTSSLDLLLESGAPEPSLPEQPATAISADEEELLHFLGTLLPSDQAKIIMLRYYRQLTRKETADLLGLSENTVKVSQYRALKTLHAKGPHIFSTMRLSHV